MVYKKVCDKNNILLEKDKDTNSYCISLNIINNNIKLFNLLTFDLWDLILKINSDYIEKFDIVNRQDNTINIVMVFKNLLKSLGNKKIYFLYQTIERKQKDNGVEFISKNCTGPIPEHYDNPELFRINTIDENLILNLYNDNHSCNIKKQMIINLSSENLPIIAEDMIGLINKNIFLRVKSFIEQLTI